MIQIWDRLSQCLLTALLHFYLIICENVPQTTSRSFDGDWIRLNNPLGIPSQSETQFKSILQHHNGDHLVHGRHKRLWGKVDTCGIYQLHRVKIGTSQNFINNGYIPAGVTPFTVINQFLVLPNNLHHLVKSRRHSSSHMGERLSQKKVIVGVNVQDQKLCTEFCQTHLDDQIYHSRRVSLYSVKGSYIDLVLFQLPLVKP